MPRLKTLLVGLCAAGAMQAAEAHSRVFVMDGHSGKLNFNCGAMGLMDIGGGFTRFIAVISIDDEAPEEARAIVKVDANSLTSTDSEWLEDMRGPDFFDVAAHPQFDFASHHATVEGPGRIRLDGVLNLRGVSKPVSLHVTYKTSKAADGPAQVEAEGEVDRTAFGMNAYDIVLSDDVEIEVTGTAHPGFASSVAVLSALP